MDTGCRASTEQAKTEKREKFGGPEGRNHGLMAIIESRAIREAPPLLALGGRKKARSKSGLKIGGGEDEDRTHDLRIANAALSQLSYRP